MPVCVAPTCPFELPQWPVCIKPTRPSESGDVPMPGRCRQIAPGNAQRVALLGIPIITQLGASVAATAAAAALEALVLGTLVATHIRQSEVVGEKRLTVRLR